MTALAEAVPDPLSRITWCHAIGAADALTRTASWGTTLGETLLNLARRRALPNVRQAALDPVRHVRIVGPNTGARKGIVYPSVSVA